MSKWHFYRTPDVNALKVSNVQQCQNRLLPKCSIKQAQNNCSETQNFGGSFNVNKI